MSHIIRQWNGRTIRQREDGYLSATDMCQACGKLFGHWNELNSTTEYLEALAINIGKTISELVQVQRGGVAEQQGTWVHPEVGMDLAQWLNVQLRIQVNRWTIELMTNGRVELQSNQPQSSVKEEIDVLRDCLSIAGIDPRLIAGVALNHAGTRMPVLKEAIQEGHGLLAASGQTELLLTPTKIGKEIGISARKVNEILLAMGFQVKNQNKVSKTEPDYLVTEIGKSYAGNTMATGKLQASGADNTTYQHLKWKETVVEAIQSCLNSKQEAA